LAFEAPLFSFRNEGKQLCAESQLMKPFRLVSWCEMQEVMLEQFRSALTALCVIQSKCHTQKPPGDPDMAHVFKQYAQFSEDQTDDLRIEFQLVATRLTCIGLHTAAGVVDHYVRELSPIVNEKGEITYRRKAMASDVLARTWEIHRAIQAECGKQLFFNVPFDDAKWFQLPFADWDETLQRWPEMRTNVEECSKCLALDRICGAVFHVLLVAEFGVIKISEFFEVQGDKPGWGAVERLQKITQKPHPNKTPKEQQYSEFLNRLVPLMLAIKNSWRHKLDHVDNQLKWLDTDFSPKVAKEIISATQGFMRVLALELPL
jgi:hypothetical protein